MTVGLFSRCCGANETMIAMTKYSQYFDEIRCMVAPQPVSLRPFYERITEILGITDRIDDIDREIQLITSSRWTRCRRLDTRRMSGSRRSSYRYTMTR
jgi:hypothetical protein